MKFRFVIEEYVCSTSSDSIPLPVPGLEFLPMDASIGIEIREIRRAACDFIESEER